MLLPLNKTTKYYKRIAHDVTFLAEFDIASSGSHLRIKISSIDQLRFEENESIITLVGIPGFLALIHWFFCHLPIHTAIVRIFNCKHDDSDFLSEWIGTKTKSQKFSNNVHALEQT